MLTQKKTARTSEARPRRYQATRWFLEWIFGSVDKPAVEKKVLGVFFLFCPFGTPPLSQDAPIKLPVNGRVFLRTPSSALQGHAWWNINRPQAPRLAGPPGCSTCRT